MKKFTAAIAAIALLGGVAVQSATPIFAGEVSGKCNAGRGNQSETDPANDCDPGKSFKNNGGD